MAKSTTTPPRKGTGLPHPVDRNAFRAWLVKQPREWSLAIAARAALRVVPLLRVPDEILAKRVFRAVAIARFAAKYPNSKIEDAVLAAAADIVVIAGSDLSTAYVSIAAADAAYASDVESAAAAHATDATHHAACAAKDKNQAIGDAVTYDAQQLRDGVLMAEQLARSQLWPLPAPAEFADAWQQLRAKLESKGYHWRIWIDWYENAALQEPRGGITEAEDAAYTDIPGKLPWDDGANAVNTEIARRLAELRRAAESKELPPGKGKGPPDPTSIKAFGDWQNSHANGR